MGTAPQEAIRVPDSDRATWQAAEELAGPGGMSDFVLSAVAAAVQHQKRAAERKGDFARVEAGDTINGVNVTKAFYGRIVGEVQFGPDGHSVAYETKRGQYVVADDVGYEPSLTVYEMLDELLEDSQLPDDLKAQVAEDAGRVLELDI